jgi:hypothetical protein
MSSQTMVISAFGFVDGRNFGGSLLGGAIKTLPLIPFDELHWDIFSERHYKRYGRLDILSRYSMVAVELLGLPEFESPQGDMALVMGTRNGCLAVDLDFRTSMDQDGGGSPLLFMYTLHNACMGEIAIRYNITGPNLCLMAGEESGLAAIWEGMRLIRCGEASSCICLAADALGNQAGANKKAAPIQFADYHDSAHCVLIESASNAASRNAKPLANIRVSKSDGPSAPQILAGAKQLSNLQKFLSGNQLNTDQDSRIKLYLNLYHRNDLLYIDRC